MFLIKLTDFVEGALSGFAMLLSSHKASTRQVAATNRELFYGDFVDCRLEIGGIEVRIIREKGTTISGIQRK